MTEELITEIQRRVDDIYEDGLKNPVGFHNSVMQGIMMGLQEAQEIIRAWGEVYND
jgi:hypothetical protein